LFVLGILKLNTERVLQFESLVFTSITMDEESLYDEFGNYIGPEIDENVRAKKYDKFIQKKRGKYIFINTFFDVIISWKMRRTTMRVNSVMLKKTKMNKKVKMTE